MAKAPTLTGLPKVPGENGLTRYLQEINQFPLLSEEKEYMLGKRWREHADRDAAQELVTSHLRLVAKVAMGYRGYGLPLADLIAEGNVGLMQAVKRFEPDRGFRLSTYAIWWIRAAIQEYVLRSWSLVKIGTTAAQKKLFFGLRRIKSRLKALEAGDLPPETVKRIASELAVSEHDVIDMNRRLAGADQSLNVPRQEEGEAEWQDWVADERADPEAEVSAAQELRVRRDLLERAMSALSDRERHILIERRLSDPPKTLEELSQVYGVTRERIRQLEMRAFEKISKNIETIISKDHMVLD